MPISTSVISRFDRDTRRARHGDLLTRDVFAADERFAVMVAGLAALSLDGDSLAEEFGEIVREGIDSRLAEDILVQMAAYLGYPRASRALEAFHRAGGRMEPVEDEQALSDQERYDRGTSEYARINSTALATIDAAFGDIAGELIDLTFRSFGDVFATSRQPLAIRQLATVSALAALGSAAPQLRFHIGAALKMGITQAQLVETITWAQYLAGMPAAYNALIELKHALAEGPDAPPAYQ
jgi:4-carboxymuconolactone decarboxylase